MGSTSGAAGALDRASENERRGEWSGALRLYEEAYRASIAAGDAVMLTEVVQRLGHYFRHTDQDELALEHFELALTLAERQGNDRGAGRALNGLGLLSQRAGAIHEAERTYLKALAFAERAGSDLLVGQVEQNRGILANIRGDLESALRHYGSGLRHLRAAGDDLACVHVLNNLGMLHVDLGQLEASERFFDEALEILARHEDAMLAGIVHINRVELFLARRDPVRARESCDAGYEIFSRLNHEQGRAEAFKFYGIIYRETGKLQLAADHLRLAISTASSRDPLMEAEAQRELALVLRAQQRNREALGALNRAHVLFTALHADTDNADVERRIGELEGDFLSLVRFWGETIEAKDRYTSGHCERVADYACMIAREAGLSEWELTWFRMGAFLHDVGKMEVPEEILNKPGRLTDEERAVMERHPLAGDDMLASVEFPWDVRAMVRSHHERWDGSGYPDRLAGDAIPLAARILRIADIFDALTSVRSYRRSLTAEEALRMMEEDLVGFDPALFGIFRGLFSQIAEIATVAQARALAELAAAPE
ncbi:MAG: diguanylate cyclase [Gemmatimonadetes bacterium]|nr:diguanylate cyclase [Gemmatimonadota bacterium]